MIKNDKTFHFSFSKDHNKFKLSSFENIIEMECLK